MSSIQINIYRDKPILKAIESIEELLFDSLFEEVIVNKLLKGHEQTLFFSYFKLSNPSINLINAPSVRSTGVA